MAISSIDTPYRQFTPRIVPLCEVGGNWMVPGYCVNTHLHKARNLDVAHQSVLLCFIPTMSEEINLLCVNQEWLDCALKQNSNSWSLPKQGPPVPAS